MIFKSITEFAHIYTAPILAIGIGLILGYILERIIIKKLIKFAHKTRWKSDDLLFSCMKGLLWPLILIGSFYFALHYLPDLPEKYLRTGDKLIEIGLILLFTFFITRLLSKIIHIQTYNQEKQGTSSILVNLVRTITISVGLMVALQSVGISIQPLLTALGITGLAVALALQSTLSNFFSGLHILASKRVRPGDYIRMDQNTEGYVSDINWRSTTVQQLNNNLVIIPNSKLADAIVVNTSLPDPESAFGVEVSISHNNDLEKVEALATEVANDIQTKLSVCIETYEPTVRFHTLGENSIQFTIFLRVRHYADLYLVKHEFIRQLHHRFREEQVEMPNPVRGIVMKNTSDI